MKNYSAVVGVYVRAYCEFDFTATDDAAAKQKAMEHFKRDSDDIHFHETDWNNKTLPSLVSITDQDLNIDVVEGEDFALHRDDAIDLKSKIMLDMIERIAGFTMDEDDTNLADDCIDTVRGLIAEAQSIIAKIDAVPMPSPAAEEVDDA